MSFSPGKKSLPLTQRRLPASSAFSGSGLDGTKSGVVRVSDILTPSCQKQRIKQNILDSKAKYLNKQQRAKELSAQSSHVTRTKCTAKASCSPHSKRQTKLATSPESCRRTTKSIETRREAKSRELAAKLAYLKALEEREKEDAAMLLLAHAVYKTQNGLLKKEKQAALDMLNRLEPVLQQQLPPPPTDSDVKDMSRSRREGGFLAPPRAAPKHVTLNTSPLEDSIQPYRPINSLDNDDISLEGTGPIALPVRQREPFYRQHIPFESSQRVSWDITKEQNDCHMSRNVHMATMSISARDGGEGDVTPCIDAVRNRSPSSISTSPTTHNYHESTLGSLYRTHDMVPETNYDVLSHPPSSPSPTPTPVVSMDVLPTNGKGTIDTLDSTSVSETGPLDASTTPSTTPSPPVHSALLSNPDMTGQPSTASGTVTSALRNVAEAVVRQTEGDGIEKCGQDLHLSLPPPPAAHTTRLGTTHSHCSQSANNRPELRKSTSSLSKLWGTVGDGDSGSDSAEVDESEWDD